MKNIKCIYYFNGRSSPHLKFGRIVVAALFSVFLLYSGALAVPGPGLYEVPLIGDDDMDEIGVASVWNSNQKFHVKLVAKEGWLLTAVQVFFETYKDGKLVDMPTKKGKPVYNKFPYNRGFEDTPKPMHDVIIDLKASADDGGFNFTWGRYADRERDIVIHVDMVQLNDLREIIAKTDGFAKGMPYPDVANAQYFTTEFFHPMRGQFIDAPVQGLSYQGPTQQGVTGFDELGDVLEQGGFSFFPGENILFSIGSVELGVAPAAKKVSPLDLFIGSDTDDPRVIGVARILQSLDANQSDGKITLLHEVVGCFEGVVQSVLQSMGLTEINYGDTTLIDTLVTQTVATCNGAGGAELVAISAEEAQGNLEAGLNASGIFRKNITKTEDLGETKQKLEVMPVYYPGLRSNDDPSLCVDVDGDKEYDEGEDTIGVPYEEWRLGGDPLAEECDPRLFEDPEACQVTLIECRDIAKPLLVTYLAKVDIYDDQVKEAFWPGRFSWDTFTAVSRDDGATWKRMNVSRMADMSSFDLETGEPFPGTSGSPYLKVNDNKILVVWESKFCQSGNPRYSITTCDDPATEEVEADDPNTDASLCTGPGSPYDCCTGVGTGNCYECALYCRGNPDQGTEVCEPDYPGDDDYFVTDIWGVRGSQDSVDYNEVDDVAELGIGEIPYSCLWAARGVIATQKDIDDGTFASMDVEDDPTTDVTQCTADKVPLECCTGEGTGDCDETAAIGLGDIVWFKPERLTSGRRDVYIPVLGSARGAGFAIAWQEDPSGLRPGKGKGPGEGWSGAITNHKSDIWYSFISYDDFNIVDETFEPGGPGGGTDTEPTGDEGYLDKPGLGRPKALVPFSLPVRVTDNDMVNTHTLKVKPSADCPTFPDSTGLNEAVCFPEVVDGSFVPIAPEEIAAEFCGHPDADPATCCDPDNHEGDPNCEDLKGLYGNLNGTKRYAYLARSIDELNNATGLYTAGGDGTPDYQYFEARGGTLDLCDLSRANSFIDAMPGTSAHERWFGYTNVAGADKLVCVASDGRLLDGDVYASRPMLQLQPYTKSDGSKSAWALLSYEESKGLGHSLADEAHDDTDNPVDDIIGEGSDDKGQEKPIKQDIGKNMMYHSFDFAQPDLVAPGHIVNLPALCGGLYPTYCDDKKTPDVIETNEENPTCTCVAGQPVPLYFDYWSDIDPDGDGPLTGQWIPDDTKFLQYRYEIARRARFLMQSPGKMGSTNTLGALIYKQGQEGQGRPADAFIRRFVKSGTGNPYKFENMECTTYLDETFSLPACPNGAGDKPSAVGYNCNVWGEASGDRLCGGTISDTTAEGTPYMRRDHINLTSHDVDLAVGVGPEDDTPDDPTDDVYNRQKVLLWSQHERNLGDESFGWLDGTTCDHLADGVCPDMFSNVRSHRGFIRGDFFVVAYALSPNWAAGRNGNDRYNFYVRKSFDGGQTWTTDPTGNGVYVCPEFRTDPDSPDPDGSGNLPPEVFDATCGTYDPASVPDGELPPAPVGVAMTHHLGTMSNTTDGGVPAQYIGAGKFEPARNVSEIKSNKESSGDPRLGTTPPTYPLDGRDAALPILRFVEDEYVDNMFFVAWGTVDNEKSTGSSGVKAESGPLDLYYTRSENYGDSFVKIPWVIGGENSNEGYGETVWRYDFVAKGEPEEQGECQLRATSDGSKAYVIWHSQISAEEDPDEVYTRWYPWKPSESTENDLWFRRLIFWPDEPVEPTP